MIKNMNTMKMKKEDEQNGKGDDGAVEEDEKYESNVEK